MSTHCTCPLADADPVENGWHVALDWDPEATQCFVEFYGHDVNRVNHEMAELRLFLVHAINTTRGRVREFARDLDRPYHVDINALCMHHRVMTARVFCPAS